MRSLFEARNALRVRYSSVDLRFTLDGNLVGDLGEAVAAELFGLRLTGRGHEGVDCHASDGRSVQVKASGTRAGPAFRQVKTRADHLLVLHFDYDDCTGEVIYNGPEKPVVELLGSPWNGQRCVSVRALKMLDAQLSQSDRLPMVATEPKDAHVS